MKLASDVCMHIGLSPEDPRLLDMANTLGGEAGDKLRNLHSVLDLLLKRVHELNKSNESLVNSALNNITGALKALKTSLGENPVYKKNSKEVVGSAQSGQLVSKEA